MSRLPYPYKEVEYIESTGTQYINFPTGFQFNVGDIYRMDFLIKGRTGQVFIGAYNSGRKPSLFMQFDESTKQSWYVNEDPRYLGSKSISMNERHTLLIDNVAGSVGIDDDISILRKKENFTFTVPFRINYNTPEIIYDVEITRNGEPHYNLIPCYDKTDPAKHTAGLYDLVNDQFYSNAGTGYFIVGPDVVDEWTIHYESAHATTPADKVVEDGYVLTAEDLPTLEEEGWIFNGWDKEVGDTITEDTTITASWSEVPTVTYDITYESEHGTAPSTKTVQEGYKLTREDLPILTDDDFIFNGWYIGTEKIEPDYEILEDTTLAAGWVAKPQPIPEPEPYLFGNRHGERYDYVRVAWENWQEHETYNHILDGSIELSTDAETKVTGNFNFEGYDTPDVNDLIRVYYRYLDDKNAEFRDPISTLVVSYADLTLMDTRGGVKANGTLNGQSVLSILSNAIVGVPYTVKKNQNVVYVATQIAQEVGLQVNAEPSSFVMTKDYTFNAGTNKLQIVNELLAMASYLPCYPDAMGIIQMKSSTSQTPVFVFQNDDKSIMLPEIVQKNDWQSTPNIVRMLYNIDDACIEAWAKNVSGSKASLTNRGNREITYYEEIGELGAGDKANNMKRLAENKLLELSADIEYVTFSHAYVPISIYDLIEIRYAEYEWTGTIDNMSINLAPSTECQTQIKRTMAQEISIQSQATVLRGA